MRVEDELAKAFAAVHPPEVDIATVGRRSAALQRRRRIWATAPLVLVGLVPIAIFVGLLVGGGDRLDRVVLAPGGAPASSALSLRVLAVDPTGLPVEVDLATMTVTRAAGFPQPVDGGAVVPGGGIITWAQGRATYYPDGLESSARPLGEEPRELPGIAPEVRVVPTPDGRRAWLVEPGVGYGDQHAPTLARVVDLASGALGDVVELDAPAHPVGATIDGLVLATERLVDAGDGWVTEPGSERVVVLNEDGGLTEVGGGLAIGTTADAVVRLTCEASPCAEGSPQEVIATRSNGKEIASVPLDPGLRWHPLSAPAVPGTTLPLPTVSPDGSKLVLGGQRPGPDGPTWEGHLVDFHRGRVTRVEGLGAVSEAVAAWSGDSRWIAVLSGSDVRLVDASGTPHVASETQALPAGHHAIAAGPT